MTEAPTSSKPSEGSAERGKVGRGGRSGGRGGGGRGKGKSGGRGGGGVNSDKKDPTAKATNNSNDDKPQNENQQSSKPDKAGGQGGGNRSSRRGRGGGGGRGSGGKGGRGGGDDKDKKSQPNPKLDASKQKNSRSEKTTKAKAVEEEKRKLQQQKEEAERIKREKEAEEDLKRVEEERLAIEAKKEALKLAQDELDKKFGDAVTVISESIQATQHHKESRDYFSPDGLSAARKSFEASKKSLKSDLKKCTAFVKKIKTGGAWSGKPDDIVRDIKTLNLSRYVEEVVAAILEAKLKLIDIPNVLTLTKAMHERYDTFLPTFLKGMWAVISGKAPDETGKLRRIYVRIVTEFVLNGISTDTKHLVKLITEVTGGKDGSYAITDAHIVVAFVKAAGFEIFGVIPTSIKSSMALVRCEAKRIDDELQVDKDGIPESVFISADRIEKSSEKCSVMDVLLEERAVSKEVSETLLGHCQGAYKTLCKSLIETNTKLQKMEKRCEQDRLLAGSLPEAREKALQDARKLNDTLQKSIEAMSDTLDLALPQLKPLEEEEESTGIEVLGKTIEEENSETGPFDDEETRSFYCDLPDFLTTIPPALLGMTQDEIAQRKAENTAKYASLFGADSSGDEGSSNDDIIAPSTEAELDETEAEKSEDAVKPTGEAKDENVNEDTPHFKLMVLLEQELPECNRREKIDELSEKFSTNHGSSKNSRKRLIQTLFQVPRTRLDLLPYYCRMAATESRVWPGIGETLVRDLEQQFHGHAKFKKNQIFDSRLKTTRYIGELTKFRLAPPIVSLRCLRRCLEDFTGANVDVACCLLESCGRYLYRLPHTKPRLAEVMETMVRLSKAKRLDERSLALISSAMYVVKPPASGPKKKAKEYTPLEGYIRHLLMVELKPTEESVNFVSMQLLSCPWNDPSQDVANLICRIMMKACRAGRYETIQAIAKVTFKIHRQRPEYSVVLLDLVLEELRWSMEHPAFKDQQRTLTMARLLGELHNVRLVSFLLINQQLLMFINLGHEIPPELKLVGEETCDNVEDGNPNSLPLVKATSGVTQIIAEDEEMVDEELQASEESHEVVKPVAVSQSSVYDPRVPSIVDPPNSVFRVKLVCTLLEVAGPSLVTKNKLLSDFLVAFQRYLFTKPMLPAEVEFSLLDTFDLLDSLWGQDGESVKGFPRYSSWLEAHNATVAYEEKESLSIKRQRNRLEMLVGGDDVGEEVGTIVSDLLDDQDDMMDESDSDDDDSQSDDEDASSHDTVGDESTIANGDEDFEEINGGSEDGDGSEDDDDEDSYESESDDSEDEFDLEAHMRQLEDEAFDAEIRKLTMDALEKGKVASRSKVADTMVSGSQFIKKKQNDDDPESSGPTLALGGKEGISFQLLKKGNRGKMEAKQLLVPKDVSLAIVATKQDDEAAKEREAIKARVLQYEAESAESEYAGSGGNVYLEQEKIQVIKNRLSMDRIDQNFGTTGGNLVKPLSKKGPSPPNQIPGSASGRGRGYSSGRGSGGRGRGRTSGRGLV